MTYTPGKTMNCPGCGTTEMKLEKYEGHYGRPLEIDVCHACNGLWFDGRESLLLSPGATLKLFQSMHARHQQARAAQQAGGRCPRCAGPLKELTDQVKTARFTYLQCLPHGRFITFFQWLREKGLVRAPSPVELAELKARVKMVNCSNCGAPISLGETTICKHCAAPVSILSSETIDVALKEIHAKEIDRTTLKPEKLLEAMMVKQKVERELGDDPWGYRRQGWGGDLVSVGVRVVLDALGALIR